MPNDRRYVLFVATQVGLGHLFTALLNSAYYAWRTGRTLALDMRDLLYFDGDRQAAFLDHFGLDLPPDLEVITDLDTIAQLRADPDLHFLHLGTDQLDISNPFPARVLLIPCLVPGEPYPISAKRPDVPFRVTLRGRLREAFTAVTARPEWAGPVVGLHYRAVVGEVTERMSKAITPDYDVRLRDVMDRYIAIAQQVAADAGYARPRFLVTSDDAGFVAYVVAHLPGAFTLASRLPDQEVAAWVRAHGHDFTILSEAVNDLWSLSVCAQLVHYRSGFSHFAILNSDHLDQTTAHYVHVPNMREILDSLPPDAAVDWARQAVRKAAIRGIELQYLHDWLAESLERVGDTDAAARERRRGRWHWECHHSPVVDNPDKPAVHERARRGDMGGLLAIAQQAAVEFPDNPYWRGGYGGSLSTALLRMGRAQDAVAPAREAVALDPEDPFLHEHLGSMLTYAGLLAQAEASIREAIAIDPAVGRFHATLGECLMKQGRHGDAIAALREATRLEPEDPHLLRQLARALLRADAAAAAEPVLRAALALREEAGTLIELKDCLIAQGRDADALSAAQTATELEPANPHWQNHLAHAWLRVGQPSEAEAAARAAMALDPDQPAFVDTLAIALDRQGRSDELVAVQAARVAAAPEDPARRLRLGELLLRLGKAEAAMEQLSAAAALAPDLVAVHDRLSEAYEHLARLPDAAEAAGHAVALVPDDPARRMRHAAMLIRAGQPAQAEVALRALRDQGARVNPMHLHHLLGIALEHQGRLTEAIAAARAASAAEPDNAELLGRVALMLETADRPAEALVAVEAALARQPDTAAWLSLRGRVAKAASATNPEPAKKPPRERRHSSRLSGTALSSTLRGLLNLPERRP